MINFDPVDTTLFVGSCPTSLVDVTRLANMKVSAVISLQSDSDHRHHGISWPALEQAYLANDIVVRRYPIRDFDPVDLQLRLAQPVEALNDLLEAGHRVYVHCNAGICRAPATVIGYLHHYCGMDIDTALGKMRGARPMTNPYMDAVRAALAEIRPENNAG